MVAFSPHLQKGVGEKEEFSPSRKLLKTEGCEGASCCIATRDTYVAESDGPGKGSRFYVALKKI